MDGKQENCDLNKKKEKIVVWPGSWSTFLVYFFFHSTSLWPRSLNKTNFNLKITEKSVRKVTYADTTMSVTRSFQYLVEFSTPVHENSHTISLSHTHTHTHTHVHPQSIHSHLFLPVGTWTTLSKQACSKPHNQPHPHMAKRKSAYCDSFRADVRQAWSSIH